MATSLNNLANTLNDTGDHAGAWLLTSGRWRSGKALGPVHPDVAWSLISLAVLMANTGDNAGARPLLERALAIREKRGAGPSEVAECLDDLAALMANTGDYAGRDPSFERALAIREKALGPDHPDVAQVLRSGHRFQGLRRHHGRCRSRTASGAESGASTSAPLGCSPSGRRWPSPRRASQGSRWFSRS
jgi:hypothetical protein